jgi:predicted secreted protein
MAGVYLAAGHKAINLNWRGQSIELTYHEARGQWYGLGSINQESGHNIAQELNEIQKFVLNHFQIIKIGAKHA